MNKTILSLAVFFNAVQIVTASAYAQNEECARACWIERAERLLAPELKAIRSDLSAVRWAKDGKSLNYIDRRGALVTAVHVDLVTQEQRTLADLSKVVNLIGERYKVRVPLRTAALGALSYNTSTDAMNIQLAEYQYEYAPATQKVKRSKLPSRNPTDAISPTGEYAIYVKEGDLYRRSLMGSTVGDVMRLSSDAEKWLNFSFRMAKSNPKDLPAMGSRPPRVQWIGEGPYFYIERWDHRAVGDAWIVRTPKNGRTQLIQQKFAYAGDADETLPKPELWVFNARSGQGFKVDTGDWTHVGNMDIGNGGIFPSQDGKRIYFARMSRGYGRVQLCVVDIETRKVKVLVQEPKGRGSLGRASSIRAVEFKELKDGFIWKSDRTGFAHYFLYAHNGTLIRQLTDGSTSMGRIVDISTDETRMLVSAFGDAEVENPYHRHTLSVDLATGRSKRLDNEAADHRIWPSPDDKHFVERSSRIDRPPQLVLKTWDGEEVMRLAEGSSEILTQIGWIAPQEVELTAADGVTPMYGVMWIPSNIDANRKYPIITYVYPGPQGEPMPFGQYNPAHRNAALAELGFVVVALGQRGGASTRGREYQQYPIELGNMRDYPLADNKAGIEQLAEKFPFIDAGRVGIYGHSGGGFMTVSAMLQYPDFYKVAVSGAGNHDNNIYEMNSGEFYFGHPGGSTSGEEGAYPTNAELAHRLKGRLLLVQGDEDDDVHMAHTIRLLRAFMEAGKKVDLALLPNEGHGGFSRSAGTHYRLRIWDYFLEHLAGEPMDGVTFSQE